MLTLQEEDAMAKTLSSLTPIEYDQLMKKVQREHWRLIVYKWDFSNKKPTVK